MNLLASNLALLLIVLPTVQAGAPRRPTAPETFRAQAQMIAGEAGAATYVDVHIESYTSDQTRDAILAGLKEGYPPFLTAVRKAPVVGTITIGKNSFPIHFASQQRTGDNKRTILVVTDQPVYFVGGGRLDAKPREGYDLAVIQFDMDDAGVGAGTMSAAARVKPGGPHGVQLDDYAEQPIKLVAIMRAIS
jgi:hypothetical protein